MNDTNQGWMSLFGSYRVPFEYKAIFLGILAVALFYGGLWSLNEVSPDWSFDLEGTDALWYVPAPFTVAVGACCNEGIPFLWRLVAMLWALLLWAVLGGAITRIIAIRIAKDESISLGDALGYVWNNKLSYIGTPICVVGFMLLFYGCNKLAAVVGHWIPFLGPILYILLLPLVLLSTLFLFLMGIGLVFGFHMIASSISTEGGDGLQAVINVFNYVFIRPWHYILYHLLLIASLIFLWHAGNAFVDVAVESATLGNNVEEISFDAKDWVQAEGGGGSYKKVTHHIFQGGNLEKRDYYLDSEALSAELEKYTETRRALLEDKSKAEKDDLAADVVKIQESLDSQQASKPRRFTEGIEVVRFKMQKVPVNTGDKVMPFSYEHIDSGLYKGVTYVVSGVACFLNLLVCGYLFSYLMGASTTIYFILRKDIDGTDFEEIVEREDEEFELSEEVFEKPAAALDTPAPSESETPAAPETSQDSPENSGASSEDSEIAVEGEGDKTS
ncbi:MAG: hypothetical protein QF752_16085 [Planctomycetota bacterium]|nr:hypothetical protein [Planctomycetota bacterium]